MPKLLLVVVILGVLTCGTSALAQPSPQEQLGPPQEHQSPQEKVEAARAAFRAGQAKLAAGDYQGALTDYRIADAAVKKPSTRLGVARALVGLGRLVEARDVARSVAQIPAPADEHRTLVQARKDAATLATQLDSQVARVTVAVTPPGAEVVIDGKLLLPAHSSSLAIDPGEHLLRANAAGHAPAEQPFAVKVGERRTLELTLLALPGTTGAAQPLLQPASGAGEGSVSSGPVFGPVAWTGVGIAGAGLIIGAVAGGITLSRAAEIDRICTAGDGNDCLEPEYDRRTAALTSAHVSTAGFVLAGVGVGVGLAGLLGLDKPADGAVAFTPLLGPGFAGVGGVF